MNEPWISPLEFWIYFTAFICIVTVLIITFIHRDDDE